MPKLVLTDKPQEFPQLDPGTHLLVVKSYDPEVENKFAEPDDPIKVKLQVTFVAIDPVTAEEKGEIRAWVSYPKQVRPSNALGRLLMTLNPGLAFNFDLDTDSERFRNMLTNRFMFAKVTQTVTADGKKRSKVDMKQLMTKDDMFQPEADKVVARWLESQAVTEVSFV